MPKIIYNIPTMAQEQAVHTLGRAPIPENPEEHIRELMSYDIIELFRETNLMR